MYWFKSWLLYFPYSSLLMHLGRQLKMAQVFGFLYPYGDSEDALGSWV